MSKENFYKRLLQILFFLTLVSPLVVDRRLFFPYITSATLFMRAVLGVLFLLWLIFILRFPKYRPFSFPLFKSLISSPPLFKGGRGGILIVAFTLYILVLAASTFFSQTPYLSFWGDAERMMGLFGMLHFFVLFSIGTSLFSPQSTPPPSEGGGCREGDLLLLLNVFVAISSVMAIHGILQHYGFTGIKPGEDRIVATVGNAGILAGYLIFGLFFSLFLAISKISPFGKGGLRGILIYIYLSAFIIHALAIFFTGTRGAYLGAAVGFLFAFVVFIIKSPLTPLLQRGGLPPLKKQTSPIPPFLKGGEGGFLLRKKLIAAFSLIVIFTALVFIASSAGWIKPTGLFYRLTHFSLSDSNIQTRFLSWQAGLNGFLEKPILGWGFENYAAVYNKNFDPVYYDFVPTDEYFDRAHNIIVELLATTGILGLVSYLLFLAAIVYYIFRQKSPPTPLLQRGEILPLKKGGWEGFGSNNSFFLPIFSGLLIAYFVQNLFIFDLLPTMLGFVIFLVVVNGFSSPSQNIEILKSTRSIRLVFLVVPLAALVIGLIYFYSAFVVRPFKALKDNVFGQVFIEADYAAGMKYLKQSVSYNTYLDLDIRSAAANTVYNYYKNRDPQNDNKKPDIDFASDLYKKDLEILPNDNYYNFKIGEILNFRYAVDFDERINKEARSYLQKAISLSPRRANSRHMLTENFLLAGEYDEAIKAAKEALSLNDRYGVSYWELTKAYFAKGDFAGAKENLVKTINFHHKVSEQTMEKFASLFDPAKSAQNQIEYFKLIVKNGTKNYMYDSTLAALYYEIGNKEEAIAHARRSAELNPAVKEKVERFIKKVEESL